MAMVELVTVARGRETVVAVRSVRRRRVYHASVGVGTQGAALAVVVAQLADVIARCVAADDLATEQTFSALLTQRIAASVGRARGGGSRPSGDARVGEVSASAVRVL